jgi:hypothetical protein
LRVLPARPARALDAVGEVELPDGPGTADFSTVSAP